MSEYLPVKELVFDILRLLFSFGTNWNISVELSINYVHFFLFKMFDPLSLFRHFSSISATPEESE